MHKFALSLLVASSLVYADNFILTSEDMGNLFDNNGHSQSGGHGGGHGSATPPPQKVVIEGVNPNSDLGKALSNYVNPPKKPAPKKKKVVKKKPEPKHDMAGDFGKVIDEHSNGAASIVAKEVPPPSDPHAVADHNDKATPPPPPAKDAHAPATPPPSKDAHAPAAAAGH